MRYIYTVGIGLLLVCFICGKEVQRPAFIVDGEPFPQGLTATFTQPVTDRHKSYQSFLFDATPLVLDRGDCFQLFGIVGVMADIYGDSLQSGTTGSVVPSSYLGPYLALNTSGAFGKSFFFQSYHSVGFFAAEAKLKSSDAVKYFQVTTVGKKWKPNFQTSLGLLSSTRHGDPLFVPLLKVTYAHSKFVIDAIVPVSAKVRFMPSTNFHIIPYYESASAGFATKGANDPIQRMSNSVGLDIERRIKGWFWVKMGAFASTKTSFTSSDDGYEDALIETPTHIRALIELFVRPD